MVQINISYLAQLIDDIEPDEFGHRFHLDVYVDGVFSHSSTISENGLKLLLEFGRESVMVL